MRTRTPTTFLASRACAAVLGGAIFAVSPGIASDADHRVTNALVDLDSDGDGVPDTSDCRPFDPAAWSVPSDVMLALGGGATASLGWSAPASPGGLSLLYDVLSSPSPGAFTAATCLVFNGAAQAANDPFVPTGAVSYLVRSKNVCGGNLGANSQGLSRTGVSCDLTFAAPACVSAPVVLNASNVDPGDQMMPFLLGTYAESGRPVTLDSSLGGSSAGAAAGGGLASVRMRPPEGDQTLTATVSDRDGDLAMASCLFHVDTIAPGSTSFNAVRSPARRTRLEADFRMPGDDGESGTAVSYEIRLRNCGPGAPCPIASEIEWASACPLLAAPPLAPGGTLAGFSLQNAVGAAGGGSCGSIDLERTYGLALRGTDEAGNLSAILPLPATPSVSTAFATDTFAGPSSIEADFGNALASVDLDDDGFSDLVLGRPALNTNAGGFTVVYGGGSARPPTEVLATDLGLTGSMRLGRSVAAAGDVDGDGVMDLLVGAPGSGSTTCTTTGTNTGRAFLFFGGPNGLRRGTPWVACGPAVTDDNCYVVLSPPGASGAAAVCNYGQAVAGVGDVIGSPSGRPQISIGAGDLTSTSTRVGRVFLYAPTVSGSRPTQAVSLALQATLVGGADDYHFGASLCSAGDATGDGVPDILVGTPRNGGVPGRVGRAYLFLTIPAASGATVVITAGGSATNDGIVPLSGIAVDDRFGNSCAGAGDLDGDAGQLAEFLISAPGASKVLVFRGRGNLDASPPVIPDAALVAPPSVTWTTPGEIAAGMDLDGDGLSDAVVGESRHVALYRFSGVTWSAGTTVNLAPSVLFDFVNASGGLGYPVILLDNWKNLLPGETSPVLPDFAIGRVTDTGAPVPRALIKY